MVCGDQSRDGATTPGEGERGLGRRAVLSSWSRERAGEESDQDAAGWLGRGSCSKSILTLRLHHQSCKIQDSPRNPLTNSLIFRIHSARYGSLHRLRYSPYYPPGIECVTFPSFAFLPLRRSTTAWSGARSGSRTYKVRGTTTSFGAWCVLQPPFSSQPIEWLLIEGTMEQGLSPQLFWDHKDALLDGDREDLPSIVTNLVAQSKVTAHRDSWHTLPTPVAAVGGRVMVGAVPDMPSELPPSLPNVDGLVSFIVISAGAPASVPHPAEDANAAGIITQRAHVLRLRLAEGKKEQIHFLQHVLPTSTCYMKERLAVGDTVCVCCDTGKDASVGVALAALQLFFDGEGKLIEQGVQGLYSTSSLRLFRRY